MKMLAALLVCATALSLCAADAPWPQFRGAGGLGVAEGQKPVVEFGPGKNLLWQIQVPPGASSPVIAGGHIYLTGFEQQKLLTFCIRRADGQEVWRAEAPAKTIERFHELEGSPAASSVATDGQHIVAYFGSCGLLCYDLAGKLLWQVPMPVAETDNDFGSGTSPIIHQGRVFLVRDLAKDSALYCFDLKTGKELWKKPREGFFTSYSSPVIWSHEGGEELVVGGSLRLKAYDPATGAERWLMREVPPVNCASPIAAEGMLYFGGWTPAGVVAPMPDYATLLKADENGDGKLSKAEAGKTTIHDFWGVIDSSSDGHISQDEWEKAAGYLRGGKIGVVAIKPGGKGDTTETHAAWRVERGAPYVPTPLVYRGRIYFLKDGIMATCCDARTGKALYTQARLGIEGGVYASCVAADGKIYGIGLRGTAFVMEAGDELKLLHKVELGERTVASPAIAGDILYIRTATKLWAFGAR